MDPSATIANLLEACEDSTIGSLDDAVEAAEALAEWLDRGGFAPHPLDRRGAAVLLLAVADIVEALADQGDDTGMAEWYWVENPPAPGASAQWLYSAVADIARYGRRLAELTEA